MSPSAAFPNTCWCVGNIFTQTEPLNRSANIPAPAAASDLPERRSEMEVAQPPDTK